MGWGWGQGTGQVGGTAWALSALGWLMALAPAPSQPPTASSWLCAAGPCQLHHSPVWRAQPSPAIPCPNQGWGCKPVLVVPAWSGAQGSMWLQVLRWGQSRESDRVRTVPPAQQAPCPWLWPAALALMREAPHSWQLLYCCLLPHTAPAHGCMCGCVHVCASLGSLLPGFP